MPRNVRRFAWLWLVSALLGWSEVFEMSPPSPSLIKLGFTQNVQLILSIGAMAIVSAILLPIFWLVVWRRKNWARWLLFGVFLLSLPLVFIDPFELRPAHLSLPMPLFATVILGTLVEAAAFFFLFTGDAGPWFNQEISNCVTIEN